MQQVPAEFPSKLPSVILDEFQRWITVIRRYAEIAYILRRWKSLNEDCSKSFNFSLCLAYLGVVQFQTFHTIGFTRTEKKMLSGVFVVELWHPSTKHYSHAIFFLHFTEFSIGVNTKMRLRPIVNNDVTSLYHRKHSTVSGTFFEKLKIFLCSLINYY